MNIFMSLVDSIHSIIEYTSLLLDCSRCQIRVNNFCLFYAVSKEAIKS
jgi:hypothetical protein